MANILKPIGFVLILSAIGAGAYFLGQATKAPATGSAQAAGPQAGTGSQPGMMQRVKDFVGGSPTPAGSAEVEPAAGPGPDTPAPTATATNPSATATTRPAAAATTTLTAEVTALGGDQVLTKAGYKVRLIGVRTPPKGMEADNARRALATLLGNGAVKLQFEGSDRSQAFVWKDGTLLNQSMVRAGWSRAGHDRFLTAEAAARSRGAGLWSPEGWMGVNP